MNDIIKPQQAKKGDVILVTRKVKVARDGARHTFASPNGSVAIDYTACQDSIDNEDYDYDPYYDDPTTGTEGDRW